MSDLKTLDGEYAALPRSTASSWRGWPSDRVRVVLLPVATLIAVILLWAGATAVLDIPAYLEKPPTNWRSKAVVVESNISMVRTALTSDHRSIWRHSPCFSPQRVRAGREPTPTTRRSGDGLSRHKPRFVGSERFPVGWGCTPGYSNYHVTVSSTPLLSSLLATIRICDLSACERLGRRG